MEGNKLKNIEIELEAPADFTSPEVLYDDRGEKAGFMFSDADLLGIPLRLVVSPKSLAEGKVEFRRRVSRDTVLLDLAAATAEMQRQIALELERLNA